MRNKIYVNASDNCTCYFCMNSFKPNEITNWIDDGETALCPKCQIDSVVCDSVVSLSDEQLKEANKYWFGEQTIIKQVIVMRTSYNGKKLRRGKEIAQACHASIAFLTKKIQNSDNKPIELSAEQIEWINGIFTKICLKVDTEEQLLEIEKKAKEKGLECNLITDRGLTEFKGIPTNTCLAIGPDIAEKIDEITGGLELY